MCAFSRWFECCVQRIRYLTMPRLRRHQVRPTEDMDTVILEEEVHYHDLEAKLEGGRDSLLFEAHSSPEKTPQGTNDALLSENHALQDMEKKDLQNTSMLTI